jgi:aminoglycoside phosphotransferase (APT) family kinase protein
MSRFDGIDPREPLAALGVEDVIEIKPISGGMDTLIWQVETSHGAYALRLFRRDQREQCSNEARAMRIVGTLGVPVPDVATYGMWGDRPAMLMEWCEGRNVLDAALDDLDSIDPIGESMGRLHARMHAVPAPQEYWDNHQSWLEMAGPQEVELSGRLRGLGLSDGHLLHLDFHPLNVLCVGREVTVVLDWANVKVGDPRADVARTMSIFQLVSQSPTVSSPDFKAVRTRLEHAWMAGYTQVAGPLPDMAVFEIWAVATFIRDMEKKIGMPDFWMEPADFDRLRDSVAALKRRAGFSGQ